MACDTFLKIAQKCRRHLAIQQSGERESFVEEILRLFNPITCDLSEQQVCVMCCCSLDARVEFVQLNVFYEAVGYVILAQPNKFQRDKLIDKLMELPNKEVQRKVLLPHC
jgi:exportin-1